MKHKKVIEGFKDDLSEGLNLLYKGYGKQLYGISVSQFKLNEDEAYDILYKTLETIGSYINRYSFESEKHFQNWLFKIHKNNILQFLRSKKSKELQLQKIKLAIQQRAEESQEIDEQSFSLDIYKSEFEKTPSINPFEKTSASKELMHAMHKALLELSETEKELLLYRMDNFSYDEIAAMLSIKNNQLKVKFHRAKTKLKKKVLAIIKEKNHG